VIESATEFQCNYCYSNTPCFDGLTGRGYICQHVLQIHKLTEEERQELIAIWRFRLKVIDEKDK